jgi:Icc-related predicted phosphoesterase
VNVFLITKISIFMKLLIIADIHGQYKQLDDIIDKVERDIDIVICPGDFTDMFDIPSGFSQIDIATIVLQKLLTLKKPTLCVPGNHDPYEIIDLFNEMGVNIHNKSRKISELIFAGYGGASTPFNTNFEPTEAEIETNLAKFKPDVLIVHAPPFNTLCDRIPSGQNVGSKAIRSFIQKNQPILTICAHIHESAGQDMIGKTKIFYPGPAYNGFYGIVTIQDKEVKCEIKKV